MHASADMQWRTVDRTNAPKSLRCTKFFQPALSMDDNIRTTGTMNNRMRQMIPETYDYMMGTPAANDGSRAGSMAWTTTEFPAPDSSPLF